MYILNIKPCDLCDFDHVMVDDARWAGMTNSETADPLGFSHSTVHTEWCEKQTNKPPLKTPNNTYICI